MIGHEGILYQLQSGKVRMYLPKVEAYEKGTITAKGSGELFLNDEGNVILKYFTESTSHYVGEYEDTVRAMTSHGIEIEASGLMFAESSKLNAFTEVTLKPASIKFISLTAPQDEERIEKNKIQGLLGRYSNTITSHQSKVTDDNPFWGDNDSYAWYRIEDEQLDVGVHKPEKGLCLFGMIAKDAQMPDAIKYAKELLIGLSFLLGEQLHFRAISYYAENKIQTDLFQPLNKFEPVRNPVPLHEVWEHGDGLVKKTTSFFSQEANKDILHCLYVVWNSMGNRFPTKTLLVCSAFEGIINNLHKRLSPSTTISKAKRIWSGFIEEVVEVLSNESSINEKPLLKNVISILKKAQPIAINDKIREMAKVFELSIGEEEIKAWGRLRPKRAHGSFVIKANDPESDQQVEGLNAVINMLNKFLLAAIGYEGPYINYLKKDLRSISRYAEEEFKAKKVDF